jgi:hypothetical protein
VSQGITPSIATAESETRLKVTEAGCHTRGQPRTAAALLPSWRRRTAERSTEGRNHELRDPRKVQIVSDIPITSPKFVYRRARETDVQATFDRVRAELGGPGMAPDLGRAQPTEEDPTALSEAD